MEGALATAADTQLLLCIANHILLGSSARLSFPPRFLQRKLGAGAGRATCPLKPEPVRKGRDKERGTEAEREGSRAIGLILGFLLLVLQKYVPIRHPRVL